MAPKNLQHCNFAISCLEKKKFLKKIIVCGGGEGDQIMKRICNNFFYDNNKVQIYL